MEQRYRHLRNERENLINYADRPPPTPSPSSLEYHEYQQNLSMTNSNVSLTQHFNQHLLINTHEEIPSYDEAIQRDQEIGSVRMSNTSSFQNGSTVSSLTQQQIRQQQQQQQRQGHGQDQDQDQGQEQQEQREEEEQEEDTLSTQQQKDRHGLNSLKIMGLNFLNAKQHLALASCRDLVLLPPLYHAFICFKNAYHYSQCSITTSMSHQAFISNLIVPGSSEYFISGIWCLVAAYLSFSVVDGLMVRWIVTYQTSAAILRVLSMSTLLLTIEQVMLAIFSPDGSYSLHSWILISCVLTGAFIIQNFVTSNLNLKNLKRQRFVDYYNITVYAVVPVGLASFVSMIALLRALLILRVDIERREYGFIDNLGVK